MSIAKDPQKPISVSSSSDERKNTPVSQQAGQAEKKKDPSSFDVDNVLRWWTLDQDGKRLETEEKRVEELARLQRLLDQNFKPLTADELEAKGDLTISDIVQSNPNDPRSMNMRIGELIDPSTGRARYLTGRELTRYEVLHSAEGLLGKVGPDGGRHSNYRTTTLGEIRGEPVLGKNIYNSQMLELIGKGESGGDYNRVFGKAKRIDLTNMTINEVIAWQKNYTSVEGSASSAAGKYQFIRKTLQATANDMGLSGNEKFDAKMQDRMGMHLLNQTGYSAMLAGKMDEGKFVNRVAGVWASLEGTNGRGVYDGDGLNAGKISAGTTLAAARMDRTILNNPDNGTAVAMASHAEKPKAHVASLSGPQNI